METLVIFTKLKIHQGKKFFAKGNFELALRCFITSKTEDLKLWTLASIAKNEAKDLISIRI